MAAKIEYKRRWLVLPAEAHLVHEHDAPWTRTVCGIVLNCGKIKMGAKRDFENLCKRCENIVVKGFS